MNITDAIRAFIVSELNWSGSGAELTGERLLIDERILDSIGILSLVSFLEANYGIEIDDREIVSANFGSLDNLDRYVTSKIGQRHEAILPGLE